MIFEKQSRLIAFHDRPLSLFFVNRSYSSVPRDELDRFKVDSTTFTTICPVFPTKSWEWFFMTRFAKPFKKFVVTKYQNTVVFDIKSEMLHSGSIDQIIGFHCMAI